MPRRQALNLGGRFWSCQIGIRKHREYFHEAYHSGSSDLLPPSSGPTCAACCDTTSFIQLLMAKICRRFAKPAQEIATKTVITNRSRIVKRGMIDG